MKILQEKTNGDIYNASPQNISDINFNDSNCTPKPKIQPLTLSIVDTWSMTSIYEEYKSQPHVKYWLHGKNSFTPPYTQIAWREDVEHITSLNPSDIESILDSHRLYPHEIAKSSTDEAYKILMIVFNT